MIRSPFLWCRAHPRSRGENAERRRGGELLWGSSPLTRGKPDRLEGPPHVCRLIPAHAGKTPPANTPRPANWAHPRSRGENRAPGATGTCPAGSSPLTRGKPGGGASLGGLAGLIPAHAGKTRRLAAPHGCRTAHPRSRGENGQASASYFAGQGSSPLTRGKPHRTVGRPGPPGLIPAHAGKTGERAESGCGQRAHPRSRGENALITVAAMVVAGSSPLTRGKR